MIVLKAQHFNNKDLDSALYTIDRNRGFTLSEIRTINSFIEFYLKTKTAWRTDGDDFTSATYTGKPVTEKMLSSCGLSPRQFRALKGLLGKEDGDS